MSVEIRPVRHDDIGRLTDVLVSVFTSGPFYLWAFDTPDRDILLHGYFEAKLLQGLQTSQAFTTRESDGVAIWDRLNSAVAYVAQIPIPLPSKYLQAITTLKTMHPRESHVYLDILATLPARQGIGIGRALVQPVIDACADRGTLVYLETDREVNLRFYRSLGFEVAWQLQLSGGPLMWGMARAPVLRSKPG